MVKSYKELIGYQKAYQLVLAVYELTGSFPPAELYRLTSQMRALRGIDAVKHRVSP